MRILSRAEFEEQLRQAGLTPTDERSEIGRMWQADNGETVLVPDLPDGIPDFVLDRVLEEVNRLYRPSRS